MNRSWMALREEERETFFTTIAFLKNRLVEFETIEWAVGLGSNRHIERIAVTHLLDSSDGPALEEPWRTAWHLIEESWSQSRLDEPGSTAIYGIRDRLRSGERSGTVVSAIATLVAPRLQVESVNSEWYGAVKRPRRPKTNS